MQSSLTIVKPAEDVSLVSLYEAKLALNMTSSSQFLDDQLELMIEWASAEIAAMCNRTFAKETVIERFSEGDTYNSNRVYLSRYPVTEITAVDEDGDPLSLDVDYQVNYETGLITRVDSAWFTPTSFSYTGGYELPHEAPKALRQAAVLMTREAYYATTRGDASIRMVAHKESRVIYFDPNSKTGASVGGSGSPARRSISDLLKHFMRFYV